MYAAGPNNPLHGITLEKMVTDLQAYYGWEMLGRMIKINCFNWQPSVQSSLKFLRKTPWARQKVEELYVDSLPDMKAAAEGKAVAPSQWADDDGTNEPNRE
ncbi:MAG TPA: VF530 family protein [Prosthecobacter sp.]